MSDTRCKGRKYTLVNLVASLTLEKENGNMSNTFPVNQIHSCCFVRYSMTSTMKWSVVDVSTKIIVLYVLVNLSYATFYPATVAGHYTRLSNSNNAPPPHDQFYTA